MRIAKVKEATTARLDNVDAKLETAELADGTDSAAWAKMAELEDTIRKMDKLFKQFQAQTLAARTSAGNSTAPEATRTEDNLVILGGFKKETPWGQLEEA